MMFSTTFTRLATTALALGLGGMASAQGICGGIGDNGVWIGGDQAQSDVSTMDIAGEQLALVLLNNQYVSVFDVSAPTDVRLEAEGRGAGDPVIELLSPSGDFLVGDDDGGGGTSSRIETFLNPGTYCMTMSSFDGSPMTGTVRIGRTDHLPLTAGLIDGDSGGGFDSFGDIAAACDAAPYLGTLDGSMPIYRETTANGEPFLAFDLASPTSLSITAFNEAADPVLEVYDAAYDLIAENDDFDGLNSRIDFNAPLDPGSYCVGLRALNDGDLPISVEFTEYDPAAAQLALIESGEVAPPLDGTYPITDLGVIETRLRTDVQMGPNATWYQLDLFDSGLLVIEVISPDGSGDPVATLFDDLGREVAYNDDGPEGLDSFLATRILPGTYLLAITDLNGSETPFRMVAERYVLAR